MSIYRRGQSAIVLMIFLAGPALSGEVTTASGSSLRDSHQAQPVRQMQGAAQGPASQEDSGYYEGGELPEVVIKGEESGKLAISKPAFKMDVDNFESMRASLEPAYDLFLSESPLFLSWSRNRPEILHNPRIIKPWRTAFSEHKAISFHPRKRLSEILRGKIESSDLKKFQWELAIADADGRVFQKYSGAGDPPQELVWSGKNERDEWIKAGHAYSAIYMFTDASGSPHTGAGNPLEFTGIVHQEKSGLYISLDSVVLFGPAKSGRKIEKPFGENIIQAAADLIKRKYFNIPIRVYAYAQGELLAQQQAGLVVDFLTERLMTLHSMISGEGRSAPFSEQRIDIVLMNQ